MSEQKTIRQRLEEAFAVILPADQAKVAADLEGRYGNQEGAGTNLKKHPSWMYPED